jgi:hypothetical protein
VPACQSGDRAKLHPTQCNRAATDERRRSSPGNELKAFLTSRPRSPSPHRRLSRGITLALVLSPLPDTLSSTMSVLVSLLLTIRSSVRSRTALQLEMLALRHQLHVLEAIHVALHFTSGALVHAWKANCPSNTEQRRDTHPTSTQRLMRRQRFPVGRRRRHSFSSMRSEQSRCRIRARSET